MTVAAFISLIEELLAAGPRFRPHDPREHLRLVRSLGQFLLDPGRHRGRAALPSGERRGVDAEQQGDAPHGDPHSQPTLSELFCDHGGSVAHEGVMSGQSGAAMAWAGRST